MNKLSFVFSSRYISWFVSFFESNLLSLELRIIIAHSNRSSKLLLMNRIRFNSAKRVSRFLRSFCVCSLGSSRADKNPNKALVSVCRMNAKILLSLWKVVDEATLSRRCPVKGSRYVHCSNLVSNIDVVSVGKWVVNNRERTSQSQTMVKCYMEMVQVLSELQLLLGFLTGFLIRLQL